MKTGKNVKKHSLILLLSLSFVLASCTHPADPPVIPTLTTTSAGTITTTSATTGGNISADGGASVTGRGVCWGTTSGPTIASSKTSDGTGKGSYSSSLSGLNPGVTYYARAFATNSAGTAYGNEISFTTNAALSTITTTAVTSITANSASSGGNVTADGGGGILAKGVCWSTTTGPTITNSKTSDGTGIGSFVSLITGLNSQTQYYVRAYATNSAGTSYGNEVTLTTSTSLPTLTTASLSGITSNSAGCGGNITNDGGTTIIARGVCWSTSQTPTIANTKTTDGPGAGIFTSTITGLLPGTNYYIRAYATNSNGTAYGNEVSLFTTAASAPILTTTALSAITLTTAISGGLITSDGGVSVTARGVCWNTSQNPTTANFKTTDGTGSSSFTSVITCLTPGTTYYLKAYATNSVGTAYGSEMSFTTQQVSGLTVTDIDGNVYHTVTIGTQVWMVENLKTTKYRNGVAIGTTTPATLSISSESMPKYQWAYGGNESNVATYGRLYTWNAVNDSRKIAPTGWHVPTDAEWTILVNYLGGETVAGGKLKEACSTHWNSPNVGTTNETGFTALAGGERWEDGTFYGIGGLYGYWWSSTENSPSYIAAWYRSIGPNRDMSRFDNNWSRGYSVRCVKD